MLETYVGRPENDDQPVLPNVPLEPIILDQTSEQAKINFGMDVQKRLGSTKSVDRGVFNRSNFVKDGQVYFDKSELQTNEIKSKLLSVNTLKTDSGARDFVRLIGYTHEETDEQTVAPEQTAVIKANVVNIKATAEWAKKESTCVVQ